MPQRQFFVKRKAGKHNTSIESEEKSWQNKAVESEREASIRSDESYYFNNKVLKEFKVANSCYRLCWKKKTRFSPLPVIYAAPQFWGEMTRSGRFCFDVPESVPQFKHRLKY